MTKFNIGSKEFQFPEMDMNFIIDIGEYGVSFDDFFSQKSIFKVLRAVIAMAGGIPLQEAGAEVQAAVLNKEFDTIVEAYQEALESSGFFQEILKQAEESQGTDNQATESQEKPKTQPKAKAVEKPKTQPKAKVVEK